MFRTSEYAVRVSLSGPCKTEVGRVRPNCELSDGKFLSEESARRPPIRLTSLRLLGEGESARP